MTKPPRELLEFLYRYDPAVQALALELRKLVLSQMAPCHEYVFEMRSKVVLLYGVSERIIKDCVCGINVFVRHVTLAFHRGAHLADPSEVLAGTGKGMRHIRFDAPADLARPEVRALLRQARKRAGPSRVRQGRGVVTKVKPSA